MRLLQADTGGRLPIRGSDLVVPSELISNIKCLPGRTSEVLFVSPTPPTNVMSRLSRSPVSMD